MSSYIVRRLIMMIPVVILISIIVFFIIQLPPGDFISGYAAKMTTSGEVMDEAALKLLRESYGLDQAWYVQYGKWIWGMISKGDFGYSLNYNRPVSSIIGQYMSLTLVVSIISMLFTYAVSIPIGIFSAVRQYSIADYIFTAFGFIGMATPNFLMAIILMYLSYVYVGDPMLGLFSPEFIDAAWTYAKFVDFFKHMIIPVIVIGLGSTAELIRVMRAQMLDEMDKPYMLTARSKGLSERRIIMKYPVRAAINPIVSTLGWSLTAVFTGSTITAIVLNLPLQGPVMYRALLSQDMYLAGTWLLFMAVCIVLGTLISDILLVWLDPRIRMRKGM
ncbi:ABC transporter permease [Cohnella lupini]|uniref:Peptide/nickel transport system permease protein n=1 Tax=Cohnella lupini TaxID=1294267 RepID=A0A3D9INC7_9BACL|nr:ABC transporter permease [Cohnella lupini]RED63260.1 peptide/nickel transport system permease protein [Cohnella lupini]